VDIDALASVSSAGGGREVQAVLSGKWPVDGIGSREDWPPMMARITSIDRATVR
jgi:hypothetical protein